jgi:hypothetical protein
MTELDRDAALDDIIRAITGARTLTPATALFHDLSLAGDDAVDLLEAIHQRFATNFHGFEFDRYFPGETEALGYHLLPHRRRGKRRLTIARLREVVACGTWLAAEDNAR